MKAGTAMTIMTTGMKQKTIGKSSFTIAGALAVVLFHG